MVRFFFSIPTWVDDRNAILSKEDTAQMFGVSRTRRQKSPCPAISSGKSCGGSMDCVDQPRQQPEEGGAAGMTKGEVCPDNEKSDSIWPSLTVWMPNPLPNGQKLVSTFPEAPSPAIIRASSRGIWGMSTRLCFIPPVPAPFEQPLRHP